MADLSVAQRPNAHVGAPSIEQYQDPQFRKSQAIKYFIRPPAGVESYHILVYCSGEIRQIQQDVRDRKWFRDHKFQAIFDSYTEPLMKWWFGATPAERTSLALKRTIGGIAVVFFYQYLSQQFQVPA